MEKIKQITIFNCVNPHISLSSIRFPVFFFLFHFKITNIKSIFFILANAVISNMFVIPCHFVQKYGCLMLKYPCLKAQNFLFL